MPTINEKGRVLYNQNDMISMIAKKTGFVQYSVAEVFNAMEEIVVELLKTVTPDQSIDIKLFTGLLISGAFQDPHEMTNPQTMKKFMTTPRIKATAKTTQALMRHVNGKDYRTQLTEAE